MEKNFVIGLVLGMLGGALIVTNSYKARKLVKEGQDAAWEKMSKIGKCQEKSEDYEEMED
ncbi:MAG: hypothetical protein IJY84_06005 [Clostridia bacterium]|nr:hypothetical protein [Clostridia bacterium]